MVLVALFTLLYQFENLTPPQTHAKMTVLLGGWVGRRIYLTLKIFRCLKMSLDFFNFLYMSLAIRGDDFNFFHYQQGNIGAHRLKMDPKIDTFGQFDTRVWNI